MRDLEQLGVALSRIEQFLLDKIGQLESNDKASRSEFYARFRHSLLATETLNPDQKAASLSDFETARRRIEEQYSAAPNDQTHEGDELMTMDPKQQPMPSAGDGRAAQTRSNSLRNGIAAAVLVAAIGAAGAWYYLRPHFDGEFSGSTSGFSSNMMKSVPLDSAPNAFKLVKEGDVSGLQITGASNLFGSEHMPIDTKKSYAMKVRLKVTRDDPAKQGSAVYAGFATFDKDGKLQTDAPGTHRYFAGFGDIKSSDGWREYFGVITGEGNERHDQFRAGTLSATPVLLANVKSPDAVILVDYIRVVECSSAENCQKEIDPM